MTEKPLDPETVEEEPQLPLDDERVEVAEDEAEAEPKTAQQVQQELFESNSALLNELIQIQGPAVIVETQLRFLDIRLQGLSDLVFRAVGNQFRVPFAIEYEARVNQLLEELVSNARQSVLAI